MATPAPPTGMAGLYGGQGPTAYVNSLYAPQQAALQQQQQARTATLQNLVQTILAHLSAPQPDAYGAAQQDQMSAANGAANTLTAKNPNASTQAMLQAIGAPQSQQDAVAAQNQATFGGGAALDRYVGGTLPAGVFGQDAAARQTYLSSLPALVGTTAIAGLGRLNQLASQENMQLGTAKATAQQTALNDLAKYVQANQKTRFDQGLAVAKYKTGIGEFNAKQTFDYAKMAQQAYQSDRTYQIALSRLGIAQKGLQLRITQNAFKVAHGGYSPQAITKMSRQALGYAQQAFNGTLKTVTRTVNGVPTTSSIPGTGRLSYGEAMTGMLKKGWAPQIILRALNQVYGAPTPAQQAEVAKALGPLAPQALQNQVQGNLADSAVYGPGAQGPIPPAATNAIKGTAFKMASRYGWGDAANLQALDQLWTNESGWNPNARNGSSGAAGIPQALGHKLPPGYATNPAVQIKWGLDYIKQRYGSPVNALRFWLGPKPRGGPQGHWY